jgi:hypothetical protein
MGKGASHDGNEVATRSLVQDISAYAFHKHWGHTALGILALRDGHSDQAAEHLLESAAVPSDHRLSSYGPSFKLADELCALGRWSDVAKYLDACAAFWDAERLQVLRAEVQLGRRPDFPDT